MTKRILTRNSQAYDLEYNLLGNDIPIQVPISDSQFKFQTLTNLSHSYTNSTAELTYSQIKTEMQSKASTYSNVTYVDIGDSFGGDEQSALIVGDDSAKNKTILGISFGIHGNEKANVLSILDYVEDWLNTDDEVLNTARDNLILYLIMMNPDGMIADVRNNDNNVNLNRNFPYYWDATTDTDKGASALSEPESQNFDNFMSVNNRYERVGIWVDAHGWTSRTTWGLICEQQYYEIKKRRIQHLGIMYSQRLVLNDDYSSFTIVNDSPDIQEYRSKMKPYIRNHVEAKCRKDGCCYLYEYPQTENDGLVNAVSLNVWKGLTIACLDLHQPDILGYLVTKTLPAVENQNSLLTTKFGDEPSFFDFQGVDQTFYQNGLGSETRSFSRMLRHTTAAWSDEKMKAGYTKVDNGNPDVDLFIIVAGDRTSPLADSNYIHLAENSTILAGASLPGNRQYGALTTDGTWLYFVGGHDGTNYHAEIYRTSATDPTQSWTLWHTMSSSIITDEGLQRHSCHIWNDGTDDWLIIVCGRQADPTEYKNDIWKIKISNQTEILIGEIGQPRGYHVSALDGDILYVFGGYNGSIYLSDIDKIDLSDGTTSVIGTSLPVALRRAAIAMSLDGTKCYISGGETSSGIQNKIYEFTFSGETISEISYELCSTEGDHGTETIPAPDRMDHASMVTNQNQLWIAIGEDGSGNARNTVYSLELDTLEMCLLGTDETTWGFGRDSEFHDGSEADDYSLVASVKTPDLRNDVIMPYTRLVFIISPPGGGVSDFLRILRLGYTIPPDESGFHALQTFFTFQTGEGRVREYIRIQGGGTQIDFGTFQLIKATNVIAPIPEAGKSQDNYTEIFERPINNDGDYDYTIQLAISPCFGAQRPHDGDFLVFDCNQSKQLRQLTVNYVADEDFTSPIETINSTVIAYPPTGKFVLKWNISGTPSTEDFWELAPLNYQRITRNWRGDTIWVELNASGGTLTLKLWFAGLEYSKSFSETAEIYSHTANGTDAIYSQSTFTTTEPVYEIVDLPLFKQLRPEINLYLNEQNKTDDLIFEDGIEIERTLDYPSLAVWTANSMRLALNNFLKEYDIDNVSNFFVEQGLPQHGNKCPVRLEFNYEEMDEYIITLFTGFLDDLSYTLETPKALALVLDISSKYRNEIIKDFGLAKLLVNWLNTNYTQVDPNFDIPDTNFTPISKESASFAQPANTNIVEAIKKEGVLSNLNAELNYQSGKVTFEKEPASGSSTTVSLNIKTDYRYLRPDTIIRKMLESVGYFSDFNWEDLEVARLMIQRPFLTDNQFHFSSHGRPRWDATSGIVRWIMYNANSSSGDIELIGREIDTSPDEFYFLLDDQLVKYSIINDEYSVLATILDENYYGYQFHTLDFSTFYIAATDDNRGDVVDFTENRIYKWSSGSGWSVFVDMTNEGLQFAHPYDLGVSNSEWADNRKRLVQGHTISGDTWVYFPFYDTAGDTAGIKRKRVSDNTVETIWEKSTLTWSGLEYGVDFYIQGLDTSTKVYIFACSDQSVADVVGQFDFIRVDHDGTNETSLLTETFADTQAYKPLFASDIVLDDGAFLEDKWWFVLNFEDNAATIGGKAELSLIDDRDAVGSTREVKKTYDNALYSARSGASRTTFDELPVYQTPTTLPSSKVYYLEGHWANVEAETSSEFRYPDDDLAGHLIEIDPTNETVIDKGLVWRSDVSPDTAQARLDGFGVHTSFISNMVSDKWGNLHFISGYGKPIDTDGTSTQSDPKDDTDATLDLNKISNWIWTQWGLDIACKIPQFNSNDTKVWDNITALAKAFGYEVGFDVDFDLIDRLQEIASDWITLGKNTNFFFRPRSIIRGRLNTAISDSGVPANISIKEERGLIFPDPQLNTNKLYVIINKEIFGYNTGGTRLLGGITRNELGSESAKHKVDDYVYLIDHFALNIHPYENLESVTEYSPDFIDIFNLIKVNLPDGRTITTKNQQSIDIHGERSFSPSVGNFLDEHSIGHAQILGKCYLNEAGDLKTLIELIIFFNPFVSLGQLVLFNQTSRFNVQFRKLRVLRINHDLKEWKTTILGREIDKDSFADFSQTFIDELVIEESFSYVLT